MSFKSGTKIVFLDNDPDTMRHKLVTGVVRTSGRGSTHLVGEEFPRYTAFLYPDTEECRQALQVAIDMQARHRLEESNYMKAIYELNNKLTRAGEK